jgi:hypothetical protein
MSDRPKKYFIVQPKQWPDNERSIRVMNPISILLGQILRRGLTIVAGYLGFIGVTTAQQTSFVDALVPIAVAAVLFAADMIWGYISKRDALQTDPRTLK